MSSYLEVDPPSEQQQLEGLQQKEKTEAPPHASGLQAWEGNHQDLSRITAVPFPAASSGTFKSSAAPPNS